MGKNTKTIEKLRPYHLSCFSSRGLSLFGVSISCALHQPAKVLIFKFLYVCISHTYMTCKHTHKHTFTPTHSHRHAKTVTQAHTDICTHTYAPTCSLVKGTTLLSGWGDNGGQIQVSTQITVSISFSASGNSRCEEEKKNARHNFELHTHHTCGTLIISQQPQSLWLCESQ